MVETIYALAALASAGAAVLAWVAKIRWANEYKQAKEAQLEAKEAQLETVKELTSTRVLTEFRALKEMFDESSSMREKQLQELKDQLENELLSKSELLEQISRMNAAAQFQRDDVQVRLKELETSLENDFKNVRFLHISHHGSEIQRIPTDKRISSSDLRLSFKSLGNGRLSAVGPIPW